MIIEYLKLRGAIGIRDGLGRDEVEIDFAKEFGPGLIAITGKNGSGKTTIVENLHPFPQLASRDGALGKHFFLRDSFRDFRCQMGGDRIRCLINIDGKTLKSEGFVFVNDHPINDGKIKTYKETVEGIFGSPDLFFRSMFIPQGTAKLSEIPVSKRKELFFELLGLERFAKFAEYAKSARDEVAKDAASVEGALGALRFDPVAREALIGDQVAARHNVEHGQAALKDQEDRLKRGQDYKVELTAKIATQAALADKITGLQKEVGDEQARVDEGRDKIRRDISDAETFIAELEGKIRRLEELPDGAEAKSELDLLELHRESRAKLKDAIQHHEENERDAREKCRESSDVWEDWDRDMKGIQRDIAQKAKEENDAIDRAKLAGDVPCHDVPGASGKPLGQGCQLLTDAFKGKEAASTAREAINALNDVLDERRANEPKILDLADLWKDADKLSAARSEFQNVITDIARLEKKNLKAIVEAAQTRDHDLGILKERLAAKAAVLDDLKIRLDAFNQTRLDDMEGRLDELMKGFDEKGFETDQRLMVRTAQEIETIERTIPAIRKELEAAKVKTAEVQAKIDRMDEDATKFDQLKEESSQLADQLNAWSVVKAACEKEGIPALLLDASGGQISDIANDLLANTFGKDLQIRFDTTRESRDGKKTVEDFGIAVVTAEGEKMIDDLSGGEQVWIDTAIAEALGLFQSKNADRQFDTTIRDESDDGLDPDAKTAYLELIRTASREGKRHRTILITHTPKIIAEIGQIIHLNKGTGDVEITVD